MKLEIALRGSVRPPSRAPPRWGHEVSVARPPRSQDEKWAELCVLSLALSPARGAFTRRPVGRHGDGVGAAAVLPTLARRPPANRTPVHAVPVCAMSDGLAALDKCQKWNLPNKHTHLFSIGPRDRSQISVLLRTHGAVRAPRG